MLEAALTRENLQRACKRVKANKGAAGVDGLDIKHTVSPTAIWDPFHSRRIGSTALPLDSPIAGNHECRLAPLATATVKI